MAFAPQANFLIYEPFTVVGFPGYYLLQSKLESTNQYQFENYSLPDKYCGRGLSTWQGTTVNWSNCDFVTSFGAPNNNLPSPTQIDTYLISLYQPAPWQMSGANPNTISYQVPNSSIPGNNVIYEIASGDHTSFVSTNGLFQAQTTGTGNITTGGTLTLAAPSLDITNLSSATASSQLYYNNGVITQSPPPGAEGCAVFIAAAFVVTSTFTTLPGTSTFTITDPHSSLSVGWNSGPGTFINTTTGEFTPPVTGTYRITLQLIMTDSVANGQPTLILQDVTSSTNIRPVLCTMPSTGPYFTFTWDGAVTLTSGSSYAMLLNYNNLNTATVHLGTMLSINKLF